MGEGLVVDARAASAFRLERVSGKVGAEILGIDLSRALDDGTVAALHGALLSIA